MKARYESFGGIISMEKPPTLVFVDKDFMKSIGYNNSELWNKEENYLSAPTEVHFSLTNKCSMNCPGCYVNSGKKGKKEMSLKQIFKVIDKLKEIGVFHVAFGGGEATNHPYLIKIAEYCRKNGIVPNITTNGVGITKEIAKQFRVFKQIHVSLDGLKEYYDNEKSNKTFEMIDNGIKLLRKYNDDVGLNLVISKNNFEIIERVFEYAEKRRLKGILLLRYKPSGRAKKDYNQNKLSHEQNLQLYNILLRLHKNFKTRVYIDCSLIPMLSSHNIPTKALEFFSVQGCDGGNSLIGITPEGNINACSFCEQTAGSVLDFEKLWDSNKHFSKFRSWSENAEEPCKSCKYLEMCKGGCHIIAEFVKGDFGKPDPECPRVVEFQKHF